MDYNVIEMRKLRSQRYKNILLYSAILSLTLGSNSYAIAKDVTVSDGETLKNVIQNATEFTSIQFEKDIDISNLRTITVKATKNDGDVVRSGIEIDGVGFNLKNEQDSRFVFENNSSLILKNLNYVGNNASIRVESGNNVSVSLENVAISGRYTSRVNNGPVLYFADCDVNLDKVSVSSSVTIYNKEIAGGVIYLKTPKSKGVITNLTNNKITSKSYIYGGLIFNKDRKDSLAGELSMKGDLTGNEVTATNIYGGLVNNEGSRIDSIEGNVERNTINASNGKIVGGFIQNKDGTIGKLNIGSFAHNTITSSSKLDGALIYNENGKIEDTLTIGKITENTIEAGGDYNGLITNITGDINSSILIDSISDNEFAVTNYLRGGVIHLQGSKITGDIKIGEINNNIISGGTVTGFGLYLMEASTDKTKASNIGNLIVNQISGNEVNAGNVTSLLLRTSLVPVKDETIISKNGNVTVTDISNNTLEATNCNQNVRGGIIYNFLYGGLPDAEGTKVSLGDINLTNVYDNSLESTTLDVTKALGVRPASGTIIANSIETCNGTAIIKSINGEYVGNSLVSKSMYASGGVISNSVDGKGKAFVGIGYTLDGDNNRISVDNAILGTYNNNSVQSESGIVNGGVIANYVERSVSNDIAQIGNIKADFNGNYVISDNNNAYGGAISNYVDQAKNSQNAIIDSITGKFENNYAKSGYVKSNPTDSSKGAYGGAISNTATITAINNSIFKNNSAITVDNAENTARGGAIYTTQDLNINANNKGLTEFTGNYVSIDGGKTQNYEAINVGAAGKTLTLNATTEGSILMNDYINGTNGYNVLLTGDSTGVIKLHNNADIKGGANVKVENDVVIDTADGAIKTFSEFNSLTSSASAKYNIDLDFSKANSSKSDYSVGEVSDGFITKSTKTASKSYVTLDKLNFVNDSLDSVINNNLKVQIIKNKDNSNNLQLALGEKLKACETSEGVLSQIKKTEVKDLTSTVNYKDTFGEVITTKDIYGILGLGTTNTTNDSLNITVTKIESNSVSSIADTLVALTNTELKGADGSILDKTFNLFDVDNLGNKTPASYKLSDNLGTTYNNLNIVGATKMDSSGKLILSELDLNRKSGFVVNEGSTLKFSNIKLTGNESAITNNNGSLIFENNNLIDGKVTGTTATNTGVLNIDANNLDVILTNNGTLNLGVGSITKEITGAGATNILGTVKNYASISQDVNVDSSGNLTVGANIGNLVNNGTVNANSNNLSGTINNSGILNLSGTLNKTVSGLGTTRVSDSGLALVNGAEIKGSLEVNNQTLHVLATDTNNLFNDVKVNSGTINLINNNINNLNANSFNINGNVNLLLDADLANVSMDRLPSVTVADSIISVKGINLLSDSKSEKTYIPFAYDGFKDKVQTNITEVGHGVENQYQTTTYAPIYKYNVSYNPSNGYFLFSRGGGQSSADFNPAVLSSAVNSQVGAYSAVNETFNYAFRHADYSFMPLPKRIRTLSNQYAIADSQSIKYERAFSKSGGIWYQPYANFENVGLSNGPRVDVQSYGSLVGGDSAYKQLKKGWGTVTTPYIGYNGTSQHYSGVSTVTNGGILGLTQTFYHGDFFTAITVNAGASSGESNTMYGKDHYATLMAGVGSKTGYNFEFNNGKFIIQPSMLMAYTYVNTFDYTSASGVKMSSDPLHSIQIHPTIKFMGNVGKGWQPYASVGMVWNILNDTKVTANDVRLPEMSIKPYVEYGVGLQKSWHERFTGFIQAMLRNGGRNGVALSFGFKWSLGNESKPIEKVQNNSQKDVKTSIVPIQKVENSSQSFVQSPIKPTVQKVNTVSQNVMSYTINNRLNILTPQQVAQRANIVTQTSTTKVIIKQLSIDNKYAPSNKPQKTKITFYAEIK